MKRTLLLLVFLHAIHFLYSKTQPINSVFGLGMGTHSYEIKFKLPEYNLLTTETTDCGTYTSVTFPYDSTHSMLDNPGLPILPIYNLMLEIPRDAHNISISILTADSQLISLRYPIQPAFIENYDEKTGELISIDCRDENYYTNGYGWSNQSACRNYLFSTYDSLTSLFYTEHILCDTIQYRGALGLSLTISPMKYAVRNSELNILNYAHIVIRFDSNSSLQEMIAQHSSDNQLRDQDIIHYFDTYTNLDVPRTTTDQGTLLILVSSDIVSNSYSLGALVSFENHKRDLGYTVIRHTYSSPLHTNQVTQIIRLHTPDYILLCGGKGHIPESSIQDGIYSDREYAINDAAIGRWVLSSDHQQACTDFITIVNKTIRSERNYSTTGTVALFSGTDHRSFMRTEFNRGINYIEKKFSATTLATSKTIGSNANANFARLQTILSGQCPQIFVYNGHGSHTTLADPYNITTFTSSSTHISAIQNQANAYFPMSFGFACYLNNYNHANCFGHKWLTEECGGVSLYGSTTKSFNTPDFYLTKRIFDFFRDDIDNNKAIRLGRLVYDASKKYYDMCKTCVRRKQYHKYNYFGDPTLSVFGIESNNNLRPALIQRKFFSNPLPTSQGISYHLYTLLGFPIASFTNYDDLLPYIQSFSGTCLLQIINSDNSTQIIKILK